MGQTGSGQQDHGGQERMKTDPETFRDDVRITKA
jgi:hypothetical protein